MEDEQLISIGQSQCHSAFNGKRQHCTVLKMRYDWCENRFQISFMTPTIDILSMGSQSLLSEVRQNICWNVRSMSSFAWIVNYPLLNSWYTNARTQNQKKLHTFLQMFTVHHANENGTSFENHFSWKEKKPFRMFANGSNNVLNDIGQAIKNIICSSNTCTEWYEQWIP